MRRKLVLIGAVVMLSSSVSATTTFAQGASDCQPAQAQGNVQLTHELGGLGHLARTVATSDPGAVAALNQAGLFHCTTGS
jgi:hypothetical protein